MHKEIYHGCGKEIVGGLRAIVRRGRSLMKCAACGRENLEGAVYCMACGSALGGDELPSRGRGRAGLPAGTEANSRELRVVSPGGFVFGGATEPSRAEETPAQGDSSDDVADEAPYIPPETDFPPPWQDGGTSPIPAASTEVEAQAGTDITQALGPMGEREGPPRVSRVMCPECYASNPESNRFCHECGSPLPLASLRRGAEAPPAPRAAYRQTAVLHAPTAEAPPVVIAQGGEPGKAKARGTRGFGPADVVALLAVAAGSSAVVLPLLLDSFSYKGGAGMFSHQGAYVPGQYQLLGGPGILPYRGTEFLTVGFVLALGLAVAVLFLALRVGRGPMFILAGSLCLLPVFYFVFQAVLPLRRMGVEIEPAVGLARLFRGSEGAPGLGPLPWMAAAAGILLLLAGFLAPPRGWGRLFTFFVFLSLSVAAAFFFAACYNWNLFLSREASAHPFFRACLPALFIPGVNLFPLRGLSGGGRLSGHEGRCRRLRPSRW